MRIAKKCDHKPTAFGVIAAITPGAPSAPRSLGAGPERAVRHSTVTAASRCVFRYRSELWGRAVDRETAHRLPSCRRCHQQRFVRPGAPAPALLQAPHPPHHPPRIAHSSGRRAAALSRRRLALRTELGVHVALSCTRHTFGATPVPPAASEAAAGQRAAHGRKRRSEAEVAAREEGVERTHARALDCDRAVPSCTGARMQ